MWKFSAKKIGGKIAANLSLRPSELSKPEAYIDRIKREFQLPEYADALVRYYSDPAYWRKLYGDDPLNSPNRPVPQDALSPPKGGSYRGAPSSSDPVHRGFPLIPDFITSFKCQALSILSTPGSENGIRSGTLRLPSTTVLESGPPSRQVVWAIPALRSCANWKSAGDQRLRMARRRLQYRKMPTPAFQSDAVYSPAGDFFGNFPRDEADARPPMIGLAAAEFSSEEPNHVDPSEYAAGGSRPGWYQLRRVGSAFPEITLRDLNQPTRWPLDAEQGRADVRSLEAKFLNSGDISHAVALYNARKLIRRESADWPEI
jgi:hypothetical protein